MTDFEASIGLAQLRKYKDIIDRRVDMAQWYDQNLQRRDGWIFPPLISGATYSHYVVRVPNREHIIKEFEKKGLNLGELIQYSIPELKCYKSLGFDCQNALIASRETVNFSVTASQKTIEKMM